MATVLCVFTHSRKKRRESWKNSVHLKKKCEKLLVPTNEEEIYNNF